jgi:hypothetical protein
MFTFLVGTLTWRESSNWLGSFVKAKGGGSWIIDAVLFKDAARPRRVLYPPLWIFTCLYSFHFCFVLILECEFVSFPLFPLTSPSYLYSTFRNKVRITRWSNFNLFENCSIKYLCLHIRVQKKIKHWRHKSITLINILNLYRYIQLIQVSFSPHS